MAYLVFSYGRTQKMIRLKVKEIAQQKGMSMGKLSRKADVAYRTIKRIYDDPYYSITITTLGRIAQALEVDPSELVEDDGK
jgi:DNA-binding Xre family transcriptional regulator